MTGLIGSFNPNSDSAAVELFGKAEGKEEDVLISVNEGKQGEDYIRMLPSDALILIFELATNHFSDLEAIFDIAKVAPDWRGVLEKYYVNRKWEKLETEHPLLKHLIQRAALIEDGLIGARNRAFFSKIITAHFANGAVLNGSTSEQGCHELSRPSAFRRFFYLTQELRHNGASIPLAQPIIGFEPLPYETMQQSLDVGLKTIWARMIQEQNSHGFLLKNATRGDDGQIVGYPEPPIPEDDVEADDAQAIRRWMSDPVNAARLDPFTQLTLARSKLTMVPSEIGKLSLLERLDLFNNQLAIFPLPVVRLSLLNTLDMHDNQLEILPPEICELSQLKVLSLAHNKLRALPPEIGKLSQLKSLDLWSNELTTLPSEINELQFFGLGLNFNPLLFVLNERFEELRHQIGGKGYLTPWSAKRRFSACLTYACRTPLASFCQKIHYGEPVEVLREAFKELFFETKQAICQQWETVRSEDSSFSSSPSSIEEIDLWENRGDLARAVIKVLQVKWQSLSKQEHNGAYALVQKWAQETESEDLQQGKDAAKENILRLIDAMELTAQNELF